MSLYVMVFTLLTCFGIGHFVGRALKINWKLSNMISAGTGICGGSAIAAIAPVIDADDSDIAYAMSATFLFDMAMIVLFPVMGQAILNVKAHSRNSRIMVYINFRIDSIPRITAFTDNLDECICIVYYCCGGCFCCNRNSSGCNSDRRSGLDSC